MANQKAINIGRGPKAEISAAVEASQLQPMDFVVTDEANGKGNELVLIEEGGEQVVVTSRTQEPILVQGINISDKVKDGITIPAGTSVEDFIKMLVQKRIAASYTQPTIVLANNGGATANNAVVEVGASAGIKIKSTFNKNDAGSLTKHAITRGGTEVATGTDAATTWEETLVVPEGQTIYKSTATYAEGAIKNDNLGDQSPNGHIMDGSKSSANYVVTGARNAFYASVAAGALPEIDSTFIRALSGKKLNPAAGSTINLALPSGQQHIVMALPKARTLKQVTYVDLGDKGMLEKFKLSKVSVEGASSGFAQEYNVYVFSTAAAAPATMNFEFLLK